MLERTRTTIRRAPGVARFRSLAERAVAPHARADIATLRDEARASNARHERIEAEVALLRGELHDVERSVTSLLAVVTSANGTAHVARAEVAAIISSHPELGARS